MTSKWVVVVGKAEDGNIYGPFDGFEDACRWAEAYCALESWQVLEILAPDSET